MSYEYYLSGNPSQVLYQVVNFNGQLYVANKGDGLALPDGEFAEYAPIEIKLSKHKNDLEHTLEVTVYDPSDETFAFLDTDYGETLDKPFLIYSEFLGDSQESQIDIMFEVVQISFKEGGAVVKCQSPQLNKSRTGVTYNTQDFKTLKGYL